MGDSGIGIPLVAAAAILSGSVLAPMKLIRGWKFEALWLPYALCAYLVSPWAAALLTVPDLAGVYRASGRSAVGLTALFGFGWGIAVVLSGYTVTVIGLALSNGILMGSSIAVGSIAGVLLVEPARLATREGATLLLANAGLLAGVFLCSRAGALRETSSPVAQGSQARKAILLCFLAGVLSTLLNVALTYGSRISSVAERLGSSSFNASNAVWAVAVSAGSLPSLLWCLRELSIKRSWPQFTRVYPIRNLALSLLMGAMWISGTVLYGAAARNLGPLGTAVGWPIYMSGIVLASAFWGWISGEWRGAPRRAVMLMAAGIGVQVLFMALMGAAR